MVLNEFNSKTDLHVGIEREVLGSVGFEVPHDLDTLGFVLSHIRALERVCGCKHVVQVRSVDSCLFLRRSDYSFSVDQS